MKSKSSFAYIDSSGIVKCFSCDERLVRVYQDGKGKMSDVCPHCGCTLNYKPLGLNLNAGQMRYEKQTMNEPLILEPEDWNDSEWQTICRLFGMKAADRIVVSNFTLETYGERAN